MSSRLILGKLLLMTVTQCLLELTTYRGTGLTLPVNCFENPLDRLRYNTLSPPSLNASSAALGLAWAAQQTFAASCQKNASVIGELMGTAFVARDMMQIVDALGEDGMLRFFGELLVT